SIWTWPRGLPRQSSSRPVRRAGTRSDTVSPRAPVKSIPLPDHTTRPSTSSRSSTPTEAFAMTSGFRNELLMVLLSRGPAPDSRRQRSRISRGGLSRGIDPSSPHPDLRRRGLPNQLGQPLSVLLPLLLRVALNPSGNICRQLEFGSQPDL